MDRSTSGRNSCGYSITRQRQTYPSWLLLAALYTICQNMRLKIFENKALVWRLHVEPITVFRYPKYIKWTWPHSYIKMQWYATYLDYLPSTKDMKSLCLSFLPIFLFLQCYRQLIITVSQLGTYPLFCKSTVDFFKTYNTSVCIFFQELDQIRAEFREYYIRSLNPLHLSH